MKPTKLLAIGTAFAMGMLLMPGCGDSGQPLSSSISSSTTQDGSSASSSSPPPRTGPVAIDMKNDVGVTVNFPGKIDDDTVQLLKGSGITYVRLVFSYPFGTDGVTPNAAYLMTKKTARRFYDAGIKVMAQSFWPGGRGYDDQTGTIKWFSNLPGFYNDFDDDYFYKTVKTATKFMAEDLKDICSTWLISNEIDINTYTGDMTFDQIIRYVKAATDGVRTGNPESSCGVNLLTEVWEAYSLKFVNALYGENPTLDWLGLDGYYGTLQQGGPETWEHYITTFSEAAKVPIVITEWSYSSAESDPLGTCKFHWEGHGGARGPQTQAEYVTACMEVFARHPEIVGTLWYALHDQDEVCWECGDPRCTLYSSWGLLNVDGSPKPALAAMDKATGLLHNR